MVSSKTARNNPPTGIGFLQGNVMAMYGAVSKFQRIWNKNRAARAGGKGTPY